MGVRFNADFDCGGEGGGLPTDPTTYCSSCHHGAPKSVLQFAMGSDGGTCRNLPYGV